MADDGQQQQQQPPPYGHDAPPQAPPSAAEVQVQAAAMAPNAGAPAPDLESMDLNILREWLDESFSEDDADVSSSDGGSESLLHLLYQHNFHQQQAGNPHNLHNHPQYGGHGGGYGDPDEMKHMMPPRSSSSKRPRAAEKRQRGAMVARAASLSDGEDNNNTDDVAGKKRAWPNQREELVYLRTKVCTLENELRELKTASRKQFSQLSRITNAPDGSGMVTCSTPGSLWEQVANRQLDEKVRAEVENRKLRGMVESQIRLAKKLQQLLRKRQIWEGLMEKKPNLESDMKPEESKIYAFLAQKIEDRHPLIDAFFTHHGLAGATAETRDVNVKFNDAAAMGLGGGDGAPGGMFVEMKEVKIMPFDFRAANVAVWRCLRNEIITMHNISATFVDTEENVLRAKVALKIDGRGGEVALTIWSLWRRYVEAERIIYCVESLAITGGTGSPGAPIIQIKQSATAIVGQYEGTSAPVASIVRVYVSTTPTIIQDASTPEAATPAGASAMERHPAVGMLTDMLIGSYHQNVEAMYKAVENLLLDEMLKGKGGKR